MFKMIFPVALSAALATALMASAAQAAAIDDTRAHFQAIASGDVAAVMQWCFNQARFQWVGGPLDGAYDTPQTMQQIWGRFIQSQEPLKVTVGRIEQAANPKGATVSANVMFEGKAAIKVRYFLAYRNDRIVNEVWQIDPALNLAAH